MVLEHSLCRRLVFFLFFATVFGVSACGGAPVPTGPASLKVKAEPNTTSVYVNDRFVGSARVLAIKPAVMRPGVKYVTFTAPGHFPHDLRLVLPSGTTSIAIKLRPIPP